MTRIKKLPSYERIFGNINFKKGDESRSVYSPAAYLADLLQLIDDEFVFDPNDKKSFEKRRGDIRRLLLDAKNTFELLPYLERVNDILSSKIKAEDPAGQSTEAAEQVRQAVYPFNLPIDMDYEKAKINLQHLNVKIEDLYRLFEETPKPEFMAKAYLGIFEKEWCTLIEEKKSGTELAKCYGIDSLAALKEGPANNISVDRFLKATKISEIQLRELLYQNLNYKPGAPEHRGDYLMKFFCNATDKGYAELTNEEKMITWQSAGFGHAAGLEYWLDRAGRQIRLSEKIGLSLTELDIILRSCCNNELDAQAITRMAVVHWLKNKMDLQVDEVCAFFAPMNIHGQGQEDQPVDLFNRVYNDSCAIADNHYIWNHANIPEPFSAKDLARYNFNADLLAVENEVYLKRISRALELPVKQVIYLVKKLRKHTNNENLWTTQSEEISMLTGLYRISKLARVCELSLEELFILFDVLEKDPSVHQYNNANVFIDFKIEEKDCYKIITSNNVQDSMWLVQVIYGLAQWMQKNSFSAKNLLEITSGGYVDKIELKKIDDTMLVKKRKSEKEADDLARLQLFNWWHQGFKKQYFNVSQLKNTGLDSRTLSLVYRTLGDKQYGLTKDDARLLSFNQQKVIAATVDAINKIDVITEDDFRGLGIGWKIADKVFDNLVSKGYLDTDGRLVENRLTEGTESFQIDTDFTHIQEKLFNKINALGQANEELSLYPSDLESLGLIEPDASELYHNLIFNGYIDENGILLESAFFEEKENQDKFEINANIGHYSKEVFDLLEQRVDKARLSKILVSNRIFENLNLTELETSDLIENLKFNEYLDEEGVIKDTLKLSKLTLKDFAISLQYYPHRAQILSLLQQHINKELSGLLIFEREGFNDIADRIASRWCYMAVKLHFLKDEKMVKDHDEFFRNEENAGKFDIWWAFEPGDNSAIFNRIRSIVMQSDRLLPGKIPLDTLSFNEQEKRELFDQLVALEYLDKNHKLSDKQRAFFLNIDNALIINIKSFEDYNKDVFFLLHAVAKEQDSIINQVVNEIKRIADNQELFIYKQLKERFNLSVESIKTVSAQMFQSENQVAFEWMLPLMRSEDLLGNISELPRDNGFNRAFQRTQQFCLLANKLKLSDAEVQLVFSDQNLVEKFAEKLSLPQKPAAISSVDAILEHTNGNIYLFKGNQYWIYDGLTYELKDGVGKPLTELSVYFTATATSRSVDAAFVDNKGNNVIIFGGQYYQQSQDEKTWERKKREWGKRENNLKMGGKIDASFSNKQGYRFLFSGEQYVRFTHNSNQVDEGYPKNIAKDWKHEPGVNQLPDDFHASIDAAFVGHDDVTYYFKDNAFVSSAESRIPEKLSSKWGRSKNNLKASGKVDGVLVDGSPADSGEISLLSGDQITVFRDSFENTELMPVKDSPKLIREMFTGLPSEYQQGVDAAFRSSVNNITYLFKDESFVALTANGSSGYTVNGPFITKQHWGKTNKALSEGKVDAALVGLDGNTYVFSGSQYCIYSGEAVSQISGSQTAGGPRNIATNWDKLTKVTAAFVLDGKTYLFGQDNAGKAIYVRYSTNDYTSADDGYPREVTNNWWVLPQRLLDMGFSAIDAALVDAVGNRYLFSGDQYIAFESAHRWWSQPKKISEKWSNIPFDRIDAAFTGKDGYTYLFSGKKFVHYKADDSCHVSRPMEVGQYWGLIQNNIELTSKLDAIFQVIRETKRYTYVFSGDQFYRYTGGHTGRVDEGYPRLIKDSLFKEPGFNQLEKDSESLMFAEKLTAGFSDKRHIYLFSGTQLRVISEETSKTYKNVTNPTSAIQCAFTEKGSLAIYNNAGWGSFTNPEGYNIGRLQVEPEWLNKVPESFKNDLDSVLKGSDGNTYLFKGAQVYNRLLDSIQSIGEEWGRVYNSIYETGNIDAVLAGRDNKTYLFSNEQFFTYEITQPVEYLNNQPTGAMTSNPVEKIAEKWGGLSRVAHAYVLDGQTWVHGPADSNGVFKYVRYSTSDYSKPDEGYPKTADQSFWKIPKAHQKKGFDSVDVVMVKNEKLILIRNGQFLTYNTKKDYWSYPKSLDRLFSGVACDNHVFDSLKTVFIDHAGDTHCFNEECFLTIRKDPANAGQFITSDFHRTRYYWGLLSNILKDRIDASVVDNEGRTYLFLKEQYVRYSSSDYCYIDEGYPKKIETNLRKEPSFSNLSDDFEKMILRQTNRQSVSFIQAAVMNKRNLYIFTQEDLYVASLEKAASYSLKELPCGTDKFIAQQKIDAALAIKAQNERYTYLFSGRYYIRYTGNRYEYIDNGYPKVISQSLGEEPFVTNGFLPAALNEFEEGIDAAVTNQHGAVRLYREQQYWSSDDNKLTLFDPAALTPANNFDNENATIDTAVLDEKGGLLVFKDSQYIRYADPLQKYVDSGYPKAIKGNWGNLPASFENGIEHAFQFEGRTYFVKGNHYVKQVNEESAASGSTSYALEGIEPNGSRSDCPRFIGPYRFDLRWGNWADYLLSDIRLISRFSALNNQSANGDSTLTEIMQSKQKYTKFPYLELSALFDWDINQIKWLKRQRVFIEAMDQFENRFTIEQLLKMHRFFEQAARLSTSPENLYNNILNKLFVKEGTVNVTTPLKSMHKRHYHGGRFRDHFWVAHDYYKKVPLKAGDSVYFESRDRTKKLGPYTIQNVHDTGSIDYISSERIVFVQLDNTPSTTLPVNVVDISFSLVKAPAQYPLHSGFAHVMAELTKLLAGTNCEVEGVELLHNEIRDEVNLLTRDVLLPYAIHQDPAVETSRDLYQKLLIDVDMSSCATTSKIKESIAAVQLYMHRYFINLEEVKLGAANEQIKRNTLLARWKWMKNYRVWEANRKVFLYPENYIRAELRDTKTPEFKVLEQDLQQGEVNDVTATTAFKRYLDKYTEISQLRVAGGYVYDDPDNNLDKNIILFGQTKDDSKKYYYRSATFINGESHSVNWQPWQEININIKSDRVYPVYTLDRIYVFWAEIEEVSNVGADSGVDISTVGNDTQVSSNATIESVLQIYFSYYDLNGTWIIPQKLDYRMVTNDTIADYVLNFSDSKSQASGNLDNIMINCAYTTEKSIKPKVNSEGVVLRKPLLELLKGDVGNRNSSGQIFLRAANEDGLFLASTKTVEKNNNKRTWLFVERFLPGERYDSSHTRFEIVPSPYDDNSIYKNTVLIQGHNSECLFPTGDKVRLVKKSDFEGTAFEGWFNYHSSFYIIPGLIGEGYTLVPISNPEHAVYFDENDQARIKKWRELKTQKEKRRATFSLLANRVEENCRLAFYPETRKIIEHQSTGSAGVLESGIATFKTLFTDDKKELDSLRLPVLLNVPENVNSITWACYDYKGGSFLCKPSLGANPGAPSPIVLKNNTNVNFNIKAAVSINGELQFFSRDGNCATGKITAATANSEETITLSGEEKIKDRWGIIDNQVFDTQLVDYALKLDDKTYLVRGDQYVRYTGNRYELIDKGYPKLLKGNTEGLPVVSGIDVAFEFGDKRYFIKNAEYRVFDGHSVSAPSPLSEIKSLNDIVIKKKKLDAIFTLNDKLMVIAGDSYQSITIPINARITDLKNAKPDYATLQPLSKIINSAGIGTGVHKVNASFHDASGTGTTYIFKSDAKVLEQNNGQVTKSTRSWGKIKNNIQDNNIVDAALELDNKIFLFSGKQYFRYDKSTFSSTAVNKVEFGYPKLITNNELGLPWWWYSDINAAFKTAKKLVVFAHGDVYEKELLTGKRSTRRVVGNYQLPRGYDAFNASFDANGKVYLFKPGTIVSQGEVSNQAIRLDDADKQIISIDDIKYDIVRLSSMTGNKLNQSLFAGGLGELFTLKKQEIDELPAFSKSIINNNLKDIELDSIIPIRSEKVQRVPWHSHLEFSGANGLHYWEIFFHAPLLIAQTLNAQQKFDEAKRWFEYLFDPTELNDYWKFLPFLSVDIGALIESVEQKSKAINQLVTPTPNIDVSWLVSQLALFIDGFSGKNELNEALKLKLKNLPGQ